MNRSLKLSVLAALTLASSQVLALDLGQIQVKSALGRPLVAEIPLHPDHPGEADHLQVSLAPASAFARAGISRADLKVPLTFQVVTRDDGQKVIRVTSSQPVREPYLDFLIQVTWPKGKMLREYTVLLDPLSASPSFQTPGTATTTHAGSTAAPQAAAPEPAPAPKPAAPPAPAPAAPSRDVYGPVRHGDTLSHVARANAIDGVSYQQMLVALKAANPDAFFKDNVNALKAGAVLRIPTRQEALSVTRKAAIAAVRRQNQSWQAAHAPAPTMVASSGGSSAPVASTGAGADGGDHLALVPPEAGGAASAGAAGGGDASASQLRQQLARSQEALSSQKQSAADLASRVKALEQLQSKNKRLLSLKNAEIAALQAKLNEAREDAGLPALPASTAQAAVAGATSVAAGGAPAATASVAGTMPVAAASTAAASLPANATSAATAAAPAVASKPAAEKPRPEAPGNKAAASATQAPDKASAPWYEQLWVRIALAILIVLLIAWALMRRRKPKRAQEKRSLADHFGDSPIDGAAGAAAVATDDEDDDPVQPVTDDDGEQELLAQLGEHPDDVGLHLELASLYYARHDVDHFESAAEAMHAYVDDEDQPEWREVEAMGRELAPDHPLFAAAPVADAAVDDTPEAVDDALDDMPETMPGEPEVPMADDAAIHDAPDLDRDDDFGSPPASGAEDAGDDLAGGMPDESEFDALPPLPSEAQDLPMPEDMPEGEDSTPEPATDNLAGTLSTDDPADDFASDGFSDDPVDTKLDLARAYIDMGDHEGARAMLQEVVNEGSQMQKDTARKLLDDIG